MAWKEGFIERYKELTDIESFIEHSEKPLRKSIRVNTLKISVNDIRKRFERYRLTRIPWCNDGFFLERGYAIGNTIEHFLGHIYIQEAASMIPPLVLNPGESDTILDMCASPGSKTTQLAALMRNSGVIVANDNKFLRLKPLSINLERCGVLNAVITLMDGRRIRHNFDKILLDAPCSGTGAIRKSYKTTEIWNPNMVKKLAATQKQLLDIAFNNLKESGTLVYSTCTLEPEENEAVVDFLLSKYRNAKVEKIVLDIKKGKPVLEFLGAMYNPEVKKCLRIWPQDNDTEGFFVAKIKKD